MLWTAYQNCDCYVILILLLLALASAALKTVEVQDFHGWLPLHLACCCNDFMTLQNLLRLYREGAGVKDNDGNLPIPLACHIQLHYPSHLRRLIYEYPKGLQTLDLDRNLPIHISCKRNDNVFVLDILLKSFPNSIDEATCEGLSKHLIKLLLRAFPESCKERDQYGMLPLHYACEKVAAYLEEGRFAKRIMEEYYLLHFFVIVLRISHDSTFPNFFLQLSLHKCINCYVIKNKTTIY
jgi:ankyrin repeat protein